MKKNARDYLRHDDTAAFLLRDITIAGRDNFSRQDALDQVFCPKTHTQWNQGIRRSVSRDPFLCCNLFILNDINFTHRFPCSRTNTF